MSLLRSLVGAVSSVESLTAGMSSTSCAAAVSCGRRWMSGVGGMRSPMDITRNNNPQLHQESGSDSQAETAAFEMKVPGVNAFSEPNVSKPGSIQPPNPSSELLEKVPIAKVTHDGDVTAASTPDAPGGSQGRN